MSRCSLLWVHVMYELFGTVTFINIGSGVFLVCRTLHRLIWCNTLRKASWKRALRNLQGHKMTRRNPQYQRLQIRTQRDRNRPIRRMKLLNYVSLIFQFKKLSFFWPVTTPEFLLPQSYLMPNWHRPVQNCWHFITKL